MAIFICVGDSITYGNWDPSGGWVSKLRNFLDKKSLSLYKGEDLYSQHYTLTYNLGIPGDTTAGLLARFEKELIPRFNSSEKTVIMIAIGINDSRFYAAKDQHEVTFETYQQNLPKILEIAKKYTENIVFVGLTPVDEKRTDPLYWETQAYYRNEFIERYDQEIQQFCKRENIDFIEVFEKMKEMDIPSLMEDGIHPNDKGYQVLFEIIKDYLENHKLL